MEGGWNGALSPESIEKGRIKRIGQKRTPEQLEKWRKPRGPLSEEHKAKLREVRKGCVWPKEFGEKISAAKKGKPQNLTEEQRALKSEAAMGRYVAGVQGNVGIRVRDLLKVVAVSIRCP